MRSATREISRMIGELGLQADIDGAHHLVDERQSAGCAAA
jgi:hypothetical protein